METAIRSILLGICTGKTNYFGIRNHFKPISTIKCVLWRDTLNAIHRLIHWLYAWNWWDCVREHVRESVLPHCVVLPKRFGWNVWLIEMAAIMILLAYFKVINGVCVCVLKLDCLPVILFYKFTMRSWYIQGVYCACLYVQFNCVPSLFGILRILNWEMRRLNLLTSVILAKLLKLWDNGLVSSALILLRHHLVFFCLHINITDAASHKIHMHKYRRTTLCGCDEMSGYERCLIKSEQSLVMDSESCWLRVCLTRLAELVRLVKAMQPTMG